MCKDIDLAFVVASWALTGLCEYTLFDWSEDVL